MRNLFFFFLLTNSLLSGRMLLAKRSQHSLHFCCKKAKQKCKFLSVTQSPEKKGIKLLWCLASLTHHYGLICCGESGNWTDREQTALLLSTSPCWCISAKPNKDVILFVASLGWCHDLLLNLLSGVLLGSAREFPSGRNGTGTKVLWAQTSQHRSKGDDFQQGRVKEGRAMCEKRMSQFFFKPQLDTITVLFCVSAYSSPTAKSCFSRVPLLQLIGHCVHLNEWEPEIAALLPGERQHQKVSSLHQDARIQTPTEYNE